MNVLMVDYRKKKFYVNYIKAVKFYFINDYIVRIIYRVGIIEK